jgi:hypothetical protein
MFTPWKSKERRARIRTRYLTPVLLAAFDAPSQEPLRGFLLELASDEVTLVLDEELTPDSRYVLRIAGEEGVSEEPACTVIHCRRNDASHVVVRLRFNDYQLCPPAAAA